MRIIRFYERNPSMTSGQEHTSSSAASKTSNTSTTKKTSSTGAAATQEPVPASLPTSTTSTASTASTEPKSKVTAGLLGIFLGSLGIHRFYLGYNTLGIIQAVGCTLGLLLSPLTCGISLVLSIIVEIWALIEGILIFAGNIDSDQQGNKLV